MNMDWNILHWIHDTMTCPALDFLMPKITTLGSGGAIWLAAAGGLLCTKKYRKQGILLLGGLAVGVLVGNVFLKNVIARSRPCWLDQSVEMLVKVPTDYSFPSGYTLSSVIGATILTQTDRRFGWAAIPLDALIAFSRLYLYVHFPSDILGGCVAGRCDRRADIPLRRYHAIPSVSFLPQHRPHRECRPCATPERMALARE